MAQPGTKTAALRAAFPHTIPILAGFLFLGMSYGIYMHALGFPFVYPLLMALTIFAGSLEFVVAGMLVGAFDPVQTFVMALMINARHLFYGVSMLRKYRGFGWRSLYLVYGMCDESFSINYAVDAPRGVDAGWFMFFITLLNQVYWVTGATLGGLLGSVLTFSTKGIEFVMVALFVVIFLDNWLKEKDHTSSLLGLGLSVLCLVLFGPEGFILPTMLVFLVALTALRGRLDGAGGDGGAGAAGAAGGAGAVGAGDAQ